ncbi:hypothetical protein P154DRAFT_466070 [Amniculicola lignicola CBS 123094]|uniref:ABM domain-containing protein n=1 Tax=Amniculicola lignicola CBS 123094 TaxID=1392246 RepID=A0A6A5WMU9_9PLEO|nr:hypothetical protein P154DRAFT_466070 [Amniculicola lignicola CBS 123094]
MSDPVVEVAYLPMVAGINLEKGEQATIWSDTLTTIAAQPGFIAQYWGFKIEEPETVQLNVEWDNIESHLNFTQSPAYGPFLEHLTPLLSARPHLFHVGISPSTPLSGPVSAPVTECISIFFDSSISRSAYNANIDKFREEGTAKAKDVIGMANGWVVEGQTHEKVEEGEEGKAVQYTALIGWPSVEAHMEFRKTEEFSNVIGYLRDGPKGLKVHHVAFKKYVKA